MSLQPNLPGMLLIAASTFGLLFIYLCLRDGVVLNRGFSVERRTKPRLYWLIIVFYLLFSLAILWMGLDTMGVAANAA
jgi:hypothetical protein